ncbi:MAG TPA: hypothetical protein VM553_22655 [Dongiaceae bacterium]|nr:hypothetical protein [Dongiaceae bacterium]
MQSQQPNFEYCIDIAESHPASNGHFVGNPLIPGVVILEYVRVALSQLDDSLEMKRLSRVKFTTPLIPGDQLRVQLTPRSSDAFRFVCLNSGNSSIASGEFSTTRK